MATPAPSGIQVHDWAELLSAQSAAYDFPVIDERSAAAMCYTSGTTGDPKGVVYSHRSNWLHSMQVLTGLGMGINGSSPCGYSAVIQPASSRVQQQNKPSHASRRSSPFARTAVG